MKINFELHYITAPGEELYVLGSVPALGEDHPERALKMNYLRNGVWTLRVMVPKKHTSFSYTYLVKREGKVIRECEYPYTFQVFSSLDKYFLADRWVNTPPNKPFYSSAFTQSFFSRKQSYYAQDTVDFDTNIILSVNAPTVPSNCLLALLGEGDYLGNWNEKNALHFDSSAYPCWSLRLDASKVFSGQAFKLVMIDSSSGAIVKWEDGENRKLFFSDSLPSKSCQIVQIEDFRDLNPSVKYAGTAIPVFSLRSETSCGIGDFGDLYKFVDWVKLTGQRIIQILPINDTTMTHTWVDSYPYNANSIYALHPAYIDLNQLPSLKSATEKKNYELLRSELNSLEEVDYERATELKWKYLRILFAEQGLKELTSPEYQEWFAQNEEWLKSYAAFSYLRDQNHTPEFSKWKKYRIYKPAEIESLVSPESPVYNEI
ncbi:MAG: 4-alpha-glucanotransferase, partial [Bacteroidales bacterium]